jgi:hypothetical protein
MFKSNRGWLAVAAALAVGASGVARADDGGDNSMNPMYGDSYAAVQGNGHNAGTQGIAPEGAYAAHEMDGQTTTPLLSATPSTRTTSAAPAPSSTIDTSQPTTDSGYRIAPVNPKGQAPTIVGPGG